MDDDNISLNSSTDEEGEFTVEAIVAERESADGVPYYLVRWKDYPDERCTWQHAETFLDPGSLEDWETTLKAGLQPDEDSVEQIVVEVEAYQDVREIRKSRRQSKRRRLATRLPSSPTGIKPPMIAAATPHEQGISEDGRTNRPAPPQRPSGSRLASDRGAANDINPAQTPVFYGISARTPRKTAQHARRPTDMQASNFRNLKHLNNARKATHREPTPDISKIQLRSPAEWGQSAPDASAQVAQQQTPHSAFDSIGSKHEDAATSGPMLPQTPETVLPNVSASISQGPVVQHQRQTIPPSHMHPHHRRDSNSSPKTQVITLSNGRFYHFPGEFVAAMKFGDAQIGDVRIKGIPNWAIGVVIRSKSQREFLGFTISKNDVVTPTQWAQLCTGRSNTLHPAGVVLPYQDTENTVIQMERHLFQHDLAALWYHPYSDLMLVFYSPFSKSWSFLERVGGEPLDSSIRVLTRNKMPSPKALSVHSHLQQDVNIAVRDEGPERPSKSRANSSSGLYTSIDNDISLANLPSPKGGVSSAHPRRPSVTGTDQTPCLTSAHNDRNPISPEFSQPVEGIFPMGHTQQDDHLNARLHNLSENISTDGGPKVDHIDSFQLDLQSGQTIDDAFHKRFQISYAHLTNAPTSKNVDSNPAKSRFYIYYPESARMELECVKQFLRVHTFQTNICTSMEERSWDAFQNIYKGDYIGVILLHDNFMQYHKLPRLASLLRSSSLSVFRLSLLKPLSYCNEPRHIERLFPSGMALLITEAALVSGGVAILKWFRRKRGGDSWKVVLPPNVRSWLQKMALHAGKESGGKFLEILDQVNLLNPGFSTTSSCSEANEDELSSGAESMDGLSDRHTSERGSIVSPSSIPSYTRAGSVWGDNASPAERQHQRLERQHQRLERQHQRLERQHQRLERQHQRLERILVEYFAGWSIVNVEKHRRFVALTTNVDKPYHNKWGHIDFLTPAKFMTREGIGKTPQPKAEPSRPYI